MSLGVPALNLLFQHKPPPLLPHYKDNIVLPQRLSDKVCESL